MNNFIVRTIAGAVYVGLVVLLLWWGVWGVLALLCLVGILGIREFLKLKDAFSWPIFLGLSAILLSSILAFVPDLFRDEISYLGGEWTAVLALIITIYAIIKYGLDVQNKINVWIFAGVYIIIPLLLFWQFSINQSEYNFLKPLMGFILVWSSDTFAYLAGRLLGKTPLYETLSPKKTMEGFAGGTLLTAAMGAFLCWQWDLAPVWSGAFLGGLASVVGTAGDLFESALKRNAGVKDSGNVIPGHGGILDRFDAFLFVAVLLWIWDKFI